MVPCEHCQQHMLAYLYDLLEPNERRELASHLESCPTCQEALAQAQQQQGMLAEAVKEVHADIVFKAPVKVTPASTHPTIPFMPAPRRLTHLLNRWTLAASMLFLLFTAGGVLGWTMWKHRTENLESVEKRLAKAREDLKKTEEALQGQKVQTKEEILAIQKQLDFLFVDWQNQETEARKAAKKEEVGLLNIRLPSPLQAGAQNKVEVEWRQDASRNLALPNLPDKDSSKSKGKFPAPNGEPAATTMQLQTTIIDQANKNIVYSKLSKVHMNQGFNLDLPRDLPIKPGSKLAIEFLAEAEDGKPIIRRDQIQVVFTEYVTHLATDRPTYRPGDTLRFRSLTLERFSLKPAQESFHLLFRVVGPNQVEIFKKEMASQLITDKDRQPVKGPDGQPIRGLGVGEFTLPENLPEGSYNLIVSEVNERFQEEKRTFHVQQKQVARFSKELQFHRQVYYAGDQVKLDGRFVPLAGIAGPGVRAGFPIEIQFVLDGVVVSHQNVTTDNNGRFQCECNLPMEIAKGVGTVLLTADDNGKKERFVRSIPLVVRDLNVEFFPEGGALIAGVPNRVYFQVRTPAGKPADLQGRLFDNKGKEVAFVKTLADDDEPGINQGMGHFTFVPQLDQVYKLRIDSPIGFDREPTLRSAVNKEGVVLHMDQDVVENQIPLTLHNVGGKRKLLVGAYCRGRLLADASFDAEAGKPTQIMLRPSTNVGGVYRITVFEEIAKEGSTTFRPLAERLIYRKTIEKVDVSVHCDKETYQPGDTVQLLFEAKNERQRWIPALATVAVVDRTALKRADEKTARSMPTHFLLTTEIRHPEDLENADVLLGAHPKAEQALDLLLGCQGWRRFAEQEPEKFQEALHRRHPKARMPGFLIGANPVAQFLDSEQAQIEQLDQKFAPRAIDLQKKLAEKESHREGHPQLQAQLAAMNGAVQANVDEVVQVHDRLREVRAFMFQFGLGSVMLTLLVLGFFLVSVGLQRLSDGRPARPWFASGIGLLLFLFVGSVIGTFAMMGRDLGDFGGQFGGGGPRNKKAAVPGLAAPVLDNKAVAVPLPAVSAVPQDESDAEPEKLQAKPGVDQPDKQKVVLRQEPQMAVDDNQAKAFHLQIDQRQNAEDAFRLLRQQGNYQALLQKQLGRRVQMPPVNEVCIVREYAHQRPPQQDERADLAETVYWYPVLVLPDGKGQAKFDLSDAVTQYDVYVMSHTLDGRVGANRAEIVSRLPFSIEPSAPLQIARGDIVIIPVEISNSLDQKTSATLTAKAGKGLELKGKTDIGVNLDAKQSKRETFTVSPTTAEGDATVRFTSKTARYSDGVDVRFQVVPDGFPVTGSVSGLLDKRIDRIITLPANWIEGTLQVQANFYPTTLAELQHALEALQREPTVNFEQNSSSNYANAMILNGLRHPTQKDQPSQPNPLVEKRVRQMLQYGNDKLMAYECFDPKQKDDMSGYTWFKKHTSPDDVLTAYGLLQFNELAKADAGALRYQDKLQKSLLDQRDNRGGFTRAPQDRLARVSEPTANAYVLWALTESVSPENLDRELIALRELSKTLNDPYFLTLVGLSHLNRKKSAEGIDMLRKVRSFQKDDGQVAGAKSSMTGSQGHDLQVETTALAMLGWLKADQPIEFKANLDRAYKWLNEQRRGEGTFGATQATILALKALVGYDQKYPRNMVAGEVQMIVGGPELENPVNQFQRAEMPPNGQEMSTGQFTPRSQEPLKLSLRDISMLKPGKNVVTLSVNNNNAVPYSLTWSYRTSNPANDPKAPLKLTAKLGSEQAKESDTVKLSATLENVSGKEQNMAIAVLGLPAGLSLPEKHKQLDDYMQAKNKSARISAWELRGRELVLYWQNLAPNEKIQLELNLFCKQPGLYHGPASRAYLYYDADRKYWVEPLRLRILEAPPR